MEVLYGVHPVAECLRAGRRAVRKLWVSSADRLWELARAAGAEPSVKTFFVTREAIGRIAGTDAHQGVAAEVGEYPYADFRDLLAEERPLVAALDNLTDPQNVGAILRSALCAGATGVTLRSHHAARITPAVAKASAGASEHLPVALVSNQAMFLRAAREAGCTVAALDPSGESIWEADLDWTSGLVLVVGAEGRGVSRLVGDLCEKRLRIPMAGSFDSLNASVAASLALFEAMRRRRPPAPL